MAYARSNYGGLTDARSQVLLIHGEPNRIVQVRCTTTRIPAEIWVYQGSDRVRFRFLLIFVRARGLGEARVWVPGRGDIRGLMEGAKTCINGHLLEDVVDQVRGLGGDYSSQLARVLAKPRPRNESGWPRSPPRPPTCLRRHPCLKQTSSMTSWGVGSSGLMVEMP